MKKQIRYFWNGWQWLTENLYPLDKFEENKMLNETEEGQYLWPFSDKFEYRTDIRCKYEKI